MKPLSLTEQVQAAAKAREESITVTWSEGVGVGIGYVNTGLAGMQGADQSLLLGSLFKLCATQKPELDFNHLFGPDAPTPTRFTLGFSTVSTHSLKLWGRNGSEEETVLFEARSISYEGLQALRDEYLLKAIAEWYIADSSNRTEQGWVTSWSPIALDRETPRPDILSFLKSFSAKWLRRLVATAKTWRWSSLLRLSFRQ